MFEDIRKLDKWYTVCTWNLLVYTSVRYLKESLFTHLCGYISHEDIYIWKTTYYSMQRPLFYV